MNITYFAVLLFNFVLLTTNQGFQIHGILHGESEDERSPVNEKAESKGEEVKSSPSTWHQTQETCRRPVKQYKKSESSTDSDNSIQEENPETSFVKTFHKQNTLHQKYTLRSVDGDICFEGDDEDNEVYYPNDNDPCKASNPREKYRVLHRALKSKILQRCMEKVHECKRWSLHSNKNRIYLKCSECKPGPMRTAEKSTELTNKTYTLKLYVKFLQINECESSENPVLLSLTKQQK